MKKIIPILVVLILSVGIFACTTEESNISIIENPAPENSEIPYLYTTDDNLYMSWIAHHDDGKSYSLNYAGYADGTWTQSSQISEDSTWFVNWADYPSIIADNDGPIAAHWLDKIPGGTYAYNVNISFNKSGNWSKPLTPHFDSTATEHGFVSMIQWDEETILAVWLDGRQSANRADDEYFDIDKAMTLRGALISTSGEVQEKFLIDDSVCDCCPTSLVKTENGAMVAYRNRTDDEIRDIYLSRFDGNDWTTPEAVHNDNWKIAACPVNGPKLAAQDATIVLAWHTAADDKPMAKVAISTNGGSSFSSPKVLNDKESLGRVDASIHNNQAYVSWIEKDTVDSASLKLSSFSANGANTKNITVSTLNSSRQTGFPQMEILGDNLIMAWTNIDQSPSRIKTVEIPLAVFN